MIESQKQGGMVCLLHRPIIDLFLQWPHLLAEEWDTTWVFFFLICVRFFYIVSENTDFAIAEI